MVVSYLEKIREKFQMELIEIDTLLGIAGFEQKENNAIIKILEADDDPNFEAFTPRPINSFKKTKIQELKEEQKAIEQKISELKIKRDTIEGEIKEVTEVIKVAKKCIF